MIEGYYTPNISEFHTGFRHETYDGEEWLEDNVTLWTDLKVLFDCEDKYPSPMRVKFLDRKDIEELGWEDFKIHTDKDLFGYSLGDYILYLWNDCDVQIVTTSVNTIASTLYFGKIRNFNELETLMKQLKIK